jgi:hypothetical protein
MMKKFDSSLGNLNRRGTTAYIFGGKPMKCLAVLVLLLPLTSLAEEVYWPPKNTVDVKNCTALDIAIRFSTDEFNAAVKDTGMVVEVPTRVCRNFKLHTVRRITYKGRVVEVYIVYYLVKVKGILTILSEEKDHLISPKPMTQ